MTPNPEILKKITKARATLIIEQPFFGTLALRLTPVAKPDDWFTQHGIPKSMAVDGKSMFYNERFVEDLPMDQLRTVVAHETGHCVYDHLGRRGSRDPRKWNVAGDYVINEMLEKAGFTPVPNWLRNAQYDGMSTDHVYSLLPEQKGGSKGSGPMDHVFDGDTEGGENSGENPQDAVVDQNDWKIATIQAANAAKLQGKLPANLERFVDGLVNAKADWRALLRRFITEKSKDDYSWSRPNRRFVASNLFLPSMYSETMGEIVVAIDTSGSIDQATLNAFSAEISAIRDSVRPKLTTVIYCDAAVNHVDEFQAEDELKTKMHGGGGTDFRPPFKWLDKRAKTPVCFIYLTDMYGSFPDKQPNFPVIWCATTDVVAPWGETVRIEI